MSESNQWQLFLYQKEKTFQKEQEEKEEKKIFFFFFISYQYNIRQWFIWQWTNDQKIESDTWAEDGWYKYKISKSMDSFTNKHFEPYLLDKELHSNVLKENPVTDNADQVKKLDDFAMSILKDQDKDFEKIVVTIRDIIRPLCWLCDIVEKATNSNEQSVSALLNDMQKFIEQRVLMVGQSSDTVTYHRWYNLLNNLMGSLNQVKKALREKKDLLQKHDGSSRGMRFRNQIVNMTKTRKTTIESFSAGKSKSGTSRRAPFPEDLQRKHLQRGRVAGR